MWVLPQETKEQRQSWGLHVASHINRLFFMLKGSLLKLSSFKLKALISFVNVEMVLVAMCKYGTTDLCMRSDLKKRGKCSSI